MIHDIYEIGWHRLDKPQQQMVAFMLHRAQNAKELSVGGVAPLNLVTYVQVWGRSIVGAIISKFASFSDYENNVLISSNVDYTFWLEFGCNNLHCKIEFIAAIEESLSSNFFDSSLSCTLYW